MVRNGLSFARGHMSWVLALYLSVGLIVTPLAKLDITGSKAFIFKRDK
jgi:hypothetical protein